MKQIITTTLFACFLLSSGTAGATIIYTDVIPDSVGFGNSTITWDMDNDGTKDFRVTLAQSGNIGFVICQAGFGTSNFVLADGANKALCLNAGAVISATSTVWHSMVSTNQQMTLVSSGLATGTWAGATDKYLGLKFISGSNTYYGWARFSVSGTAVNATLKDYAYENTPNQQILAGQTTSTGIDLNVADVLSAKPFPVPASSEVTFTLSGNQSALVLSISDVAGRLVKKVTVPAGAIRFSADLSDLAEGVYTYTFANDAVNASGRIQVAR